MSNSSTSLYVTGSLYKDCDRPSTNRVDLHFPTFLGTVHSSFYYITCKCLHLDLQLSGSNDILKSSGECNSHIHHLWSYWSQLTIGMDLL
jgi:hypothetical protein